MEMVALVVNGLLALALIMVEAVVVAPTLEVAITPVLAVRVVVVQAL